MPEATTTAPLHLMVVVGTRPEAIKLLPVILEARRRPEAVQVTIVSTGQHREMLDAVFQHFDVRPDVDLALMKPGQQPGEVLVAAMQALDAVMDTHRPDVVMVQGDTTTALAGALAASFRRLRVAHVEAGLRSHDRAFPWPEEDNRRLIAQVTDVHFPPTEGAKANLLAEGVAPEACVVTGNTGIDALLQTLTRFPVEASSKDADTRQLLLTCHRRESFGPPMESICDAVLRLLEEHPELHCTCPVHPNPAVRAVLETRLGSHPRIRLTAPLDYVRFVQAMAQSDLILSDSGGVQEEAPSLGSPVLVLRNVTERPEAVDAGVAQLVGTDAERIYQAATHLLNDAEAYAAMARTANPFGDGKASARILDTLTRLGS
ncbi:MAG: non-hydrolyzing UDP-N-acetylglucosamine 2-epimerase [Planctomycetota bacterium]